MIVYDYDCICVYSSILHWSGKRSTKDHKRYSRKIALQIHAEFTIKCSFVSVEVVRPHGYRSTICFQIRAARWQSPWGCTCVCVCTHLSGVHVLHGCCKAHHMSQQNRKTVHARVRNKQAERLGWRQHFSCCKKLTMWDPINSWATTEPYFARASQKKNYNIYIYVYIIYIYRAIKHGL